MSRLPQPGGDNGNWGTILNNFLTTSHNNDGTLKAQNDITDAKTKADSAVQSINGKTGATVTLAATDINAEPAGLSDDTKAALGAIYGAERPSSIPSNQVLKYSFRASNSAYNMKAANLARMRAAAGKAFAGLARFDIAMIGTSLSAGTGAMAKTGSWPSRLHALLVQRGYPSGGSGFIAAQSNNSATPDGRVAYGLGWSAFSTNQSVLMQCSTVNSTATFADVEFSTNITIWYIDYFTETWTYAIDGAAAVSVTNTNSGTLKKTTVTVAAGIHTVVINSGTGVTSSQPFYLMGVEFTNATGVAVHNGGVGGMHVLNADSIAPYSPLSLTLAIAPRLTFVELGANEVSPLTSAFTAGIQDVITKLTAVGSDVVILGTSPSGDGTRPIAAVLAADYALADANDIPLIDFSDLLVSWASLSALGLGYTTDGLLVHLTDGGYADEARAIMNALGL